VEKTVREDVVILLDTTRSMLIERERAPKFQCRQLVALGKLDRL
jgi:hypothetical protein